MDSVHALEATKTGFELVLLGTPTLRDSLGHTPIGLGSGKPLALLCFLTLRGEARRDEALALLWGDVDEDRARNAFRQALHRLRLALGDDLVVGDRVTLRVALSHRLRADVLEFEKAVGESRFDDALALYRGDLLEGFDIGSPAFDQWAEGERARLRSKCQSAAESAAQRAMLDARLDDAERAIRKLLTVAPLDARVIESAATSFVSMGQRAKAAEILQQFARRSSQELGIALPDRLRTMLGRIEPQSRAPLREGPGESPFVGRTAELARLLSSWHALTADSGRTVVVEGPTGSGKSRLVREFSDRLRALGHFHVLHGTESPRGYTAPYAGIASALRPLVRAAGVAGASPHLLAEAARLLPELRDAFQLPQIEAAQEETARLRIAEGVAALLEAAAYEQHICLVLEDVHRASESTLELLGYLVRRLRRSPVLLVLTFNPDEAMQDAAARLRALEPHSLHLKPLGSSPATLRSRVSATLLRQFPHWRYLSAAAVATSVIAVAVTALTPPVSARAFAISDTLLVSKTRDARRGLIHLVTSGSGALKVSEPRERPASRPAWSDSLVLPWVNALPSPNGRMVAVERVTTQGSNLFLITASRRDTLALVVGDVEALGMGWSPDGQSFLLTRRSARTAGNTRAALHAVSATHAHPPIPVDTSPGHSVIEAAWSPDGSRIGWVARVSDNEEVFVALADGSDRRNLSAHPAQDYHLAWSADGSLVAFTSRRDGNAEIYAYDLLNERLWRLTKHDAQDDRAVFAGDGRFVAFESTRGGAPDVYVMPTLGGGIQRVGDSTSRFQIVGWRRLQARFIDRLDVRAPARVAVGDTVSLRAGAFDQNGSPLVLDHARWDVVDDALLQALPRAADSTIQRRFLARAEGLARIAVSVGAWRSDTAYVGIGNGAIALLRDDFEGASLRSWWRPLGQPAPRASRIPSGESVLLLNADRQWESGVLSNTTIPLLSGLSVTAALRAPFDVHAAATTASIALVAPDPPDANDAEAPQPFRFVSITWNADARRLIYAAEREVFAEAVPPGRSSHVRILGILVNADGTVSFFVDGAERWRSTLSVLDTDRSARAQLWLGGQDTGAHVAVADVRVSLTIPRR